MNSCARFGAVVTAAVALTVPLVSIAPALAAPGTSLSQSSCDAQGGTFVRAKGVKSCTVVTSHEESVLQHASVLGPFADTIDFPDAGYYAEWRRHSTYSDTTVQTQKGGGGVTTTMTSALVSTYADSPVCVSSPDGGFTTGFAYEFQCADLGLYPADIRGL